MTINSQVMELLARYEAARRRGESITPAELCRDHPELQAEISQRLGKLAQLNNMLTGAEPEETGAGDSSPSHRNLDTAPEMRQAGRYQPLYLHARGGLGEVYLADDAELERTVALKRIQERRLHDSSSRRRFLLEAKITGRLEHPGIVPIYGLTHDEAGEPCYAMRFVQGETLQDAIKRLHESKTGTDRKSSERRLIFRQLLGRFVAVCNTIAYAHNRGVLHRDLKPANIMLGPFGETLVVDWGLAKTGIMFPAPTLNKAECRNEQPATAPDLASVRPVDSHPTPDPMLPTPDWATEHGLTMGTPAYMSPEQAAGDWNRVGPASDIFSLGAMLYALLTGRAPYQSIDDLDRIRRGEFTPPRAIAGDVPVALDAISCRAMAALPEDRYRTATDLAADVEQWLADEPVKAWREPWTQRAARWARRHKAVVAGGGMLCLTALVASLVATGLLARANENTKRERDRSTEREADARAMFTYLKDALLAVARPENKGYKVTLREALDAAAPRIDETFAGRPKVEAEVRLTVGETYRQLGAYALSEPHLRRSLQLNLDSLGADHPETLMAVNHLGWLFFDQGKLDEAEPLFRQNLEARIRVLGADHLDTRRAVNNLGSTLLLKGKYEEAEPLLQQTLEASRKALGSDHRDTLAAANNLVFALKDQGKLAQAELLLRENLVVRRRVHGPEHPDTLTVENNLAVVLREQRKLTEAEQLHRQNLEARRRVVGVDHPDTLIAINNLAIVLQAQQNFLEAEDLFRDSLQLRRNSLPEGHPQIADSLLGLGRLLAETGKPSEAEPLLREGLEIRRKKMPPGHARIAEAERMMGYCLTLLGKHADAEPLLLSGYTPFLLGKGAGSPAQQQALDHLVQLYESWDKPAQAAEWRVKRDAIASPNTEKQK